MKNRLVILGADFSANAILGKIETSYSLNVDITSVDVPRLSPATIYATSELQTYNDDVLMGSAPAPISVSATNGVVATVGDPDGSLYPIVIDGSAATAESCTVTIVQIGSSNVATVEAICQIYAVKRTTNAPLMDVVYAQGWSASPDYMTFDEAAAVTTFGTAFQNNTEITSFDESSYFTSLNNLVKTFYGCTNLVSVGSFNAEKMNARICSYNNGAFQNCTSLKTYDIRWLGKAEETIDISTMFRGCENLEEVIGLEELEGSPNGISLENLFTSCTKLKHIDLGGIKFQTWGSSLCANCSSLESVVFPQKWKGLSNLVFSNCTSLKTITSRVPVDFSELTYTISGLFTNYSTLENIFECTGINVSFTASGHKNLTRQSLLNLINGLADRTGQDALTMTIGSTNLTKLTDEDKAIATAKNWTLA